jgi:chitodextrinase
VISGVRAQAASVSASITWVTNEASSTKVAYWSGSGVRTTVTGANGVTSHTVNITGLSRKTNYSYTVQSADAAGNVSTSATYYFKTSR